MDDQHQQADPPQNNPAPQQPAPSGGDTTEIQPKQSPESVWGEGQSTLTSGEPVNAFYATDPEIMNKKREQEAGKESAAHSLAEVSIPIEVDPSGKVTQAESETPDGLRIRITAEHTPPDKAGADGEVREPPTTGREDVPGAGSPESASKEPSPVGEGADHAPQESVQEPAKGDDEKTQEEGKAEAVKVPQAKDQTGGAVKGVSAESTDVQEPAESAPQSDGKQVEGEDAGGGEGKGEEGGRSRASPTPSPTASKESSPVAEGASTPPLPAPPQPEEGSSGGDVGDAESASRPPEKTAFAQDVMDRQNVPPSKQDGGTQSSDDADTETDGAEKSTGAEVNTTEEEPEEEPDTTFENSEDQLNGKKNQKQREGEDPDDPDNLQKGMESAAEDFAKAALKKSGWGIVGVWAWEHKKVVIPLVVVVVVAPSTFLFVLLLQFAHCISDPGKAVVCMKELPGMAAPVLDVIKENVLNIVQ